MRKKKISSALLVVAQPGVPVAAVAAGGNEEMKVLTQIAIVDAASRPVVTVEAVNSSLAFSKAKQISVNSEMISRLTGLLQAVPSVLTSASASGKQLMEVVVNGELVRAADGNGFRAVAMGEKGIKEHARLFEVKNLQNMINATAVWQIASVVVAQKHLADISAKLDDIKNGVQGISEFLVEQRRARIQSTYEYLNQAFSALNAGELSPSVRIELESCERDLAEILDQLQQEYQREVSKKVLHKETFGTEKLAADIGKKIERLQGLGRDIEFCIKTRIAAWHVLSLYPGEPKLKLARKESIERAIAGLEGLIPHFSQNLNEEIGSIKSFWNRDSTLEARKQAMQGKLSIAGDSMALGVKSASEGLAKTSGLFLAYDQPSRLWLEFENGELTQARNEFG